MRLTILLIAALGLAGCAATSPGMRLGGVMASSYVRIVSIAPDMVELEATGRRLRLSAPPGLCVARDGLMSARGSTFVLMERCGPEAPGVLSVSVGDAPLAPADDFEEALFALEEELGREEALGRLGFDAGSGAVFLIASEIRDGALYLTLEDRGSGALPFAGSHMARAFTQINGRLLIATLIEARARGMDGDALTEALVAIVEGWRAENAPTG